MSDRPNMTGGDDAKSKRRLGSGQYQKRLHKYYTENEEAYHNAYPDTRYPWTVGFLRGFTSRARKPYVLGIAIGIVAALVIWLLYVSFFYSSV